MTKNTLFLLATAISLITLGVGCVPEVILKPLNLGSDSSSNTSITAVDPINNGSDELAISAVVEQSIEIVKTNVGTSTTATKSYVAALALYGANNTRIQFLNCSGNPGSLNIKRGTKFMFDNRDDKSHNFGIGTKFFKLGAYNYAVLTVAKTGSFNITCDGGGAAKVVVQS